MQLTDEIEQSIDMKIEAFLNVINEPKVRRRRDADNLLLNEKITTNINILKGFENRGVVPINFPQDICMFRIHEKSFAVALNYGKQIEENVLTIFKRANGTFHKVHEYKSKYLSKIDCSAVNNIGYIAVMNSINVKMTPDELLQSGSFVYRIKLDINTDDVSVDKFQIFAESNQLAVRLWAREQELYLVYTYITDSTSDLNKCTVFKLSSNNFDPVDNVPCQNARVVEFFTIHHDLMILIGNYRENNGTTNAFSTIMRYDLTDRRFHEHQKLYTNAITVGKYFYLDYQNQRQHFLFIGNSFELNEFGLINYDVPSIVYKLVDKFFVPLQTMHLKHVQAFSSFLGKNNEFQLLISSQGSEVQIYFYDGWKFRESSLDFTGSAFSSGVVSIRSYDNIIGNTTTIVISNVNTHGNQANIFTPVYSRRSDSSKLKSSIANWCTDRFAEVEAFSIDEADENLRAAINMTDPSSDHARFTGNIFIKDATINEINTNQLMRRNTIFNKTTVDRINELSFRAKILEKDMRKLKEKIDFTKATTSRVRRQASSFSNDEPIVRTLIVDDFIEINSINGKPIGDLIYKDNRRNTQLNSIVANEIAIKKDLFVDGKIDGIQMSADNVILNLPQQQLRPMTIDQLNVKKSLDTLYVNDLSFDEFLKLLRRKVDHKIPNMIHQLNVDVLNVGSSLNGDNFTDIFVHALKTIGSQSVAAPMIIEDLYSNGIVFDRSREVISDVPITHLLNIKDTKPIKIAQDIQFERDLHVKNLFVEERINNVQVVNGQLQVMRKRGLAEQTVTGEKSFNVIYLKEPIVLRGKIESKTLEKMNPMVTIDKNLILQGDYVIKGPVTIRRYLNATENIFTKNPKMNFRKLTENGINLYTTKGTNSKLAFTNVVEVQGTFNAASINGKLVEKFVKLNSEKEQIVSGMKTFKNSIYVSDGTVNADILNDVDLKRLDSTILKRHSSVTQSIDGNIEFAEIRVDRIVSPNVSLNGKSIASYLNTNTPQDLQDVKVNAFRAKNLYADNMDHKNGAKIFGSDFNFLIDDSVTKDSFIDSVVAHKKFGHLKVDQLEFDEGNEWKTKIGNFNNMIVEEFNVSDNHVFDNEMRIENLYIRGTINGISYDDMVKKWMQVEGEQTFTVAQTFKSIKANENIAISSGYVNDVELEKLQQESIWIDEPISVDSMEIDGTLFIREKIMTPLINGATFEDKIIRNNTLNEQQFHRVKINRKAHIRDLKFNEINGIKVGEFLSVFRESKSDEVNLKINGLLHLDYANISALNNAQLAELYQNVWLRNREIKLTGSDIKFMGENEFKNIIYADTLNNEDLDYAIANYLSVSKDQIVYGNLNIIGTVSAEKTNFYVHKMIVPNFIRIDDNTILNLTHFANNIMRHDIPQHVASSWKVQRLVLYGNYNGLINGMNFVDDVLHYGNMYTARITGHKKIKSLSAYDVNTQYVNGVDVKDWIDNSVKLNMSDPQQIIEGKVIFKKPVHFFNNLVVRGTVNGIAIRPENILTKSSKNQVITGDLTMQNIPKQSEQFKQLFIDKLSVKEGINEMNWNEFHENAFTRNSDFIHSERIIFERELQVDSVKTDKSIYGTDIGEFLKGSSASSNMMKFKENMEYLTKLGDDLMNSLNDAVIELSHFEKHQSLDGRNIHKIVLFSMKNGHHIDYYLAILERNQMEEIKFHKWNRQIQQFIVDDTIKPLQYNPELHQITQFDKIVYEGRDTLFVEVYEKSSRSYIQYLMHYDFAYKVFTTISEGSQVPTIYFTWKDGLAACHGMVYQSYENIVVNCNGNKDTVIQTRPIKKVSQNDVLVILTNDERVQVWHNQKFYSLPLIINPQSFTSIIYKDKVYIAVCSDKYGEDQGYINIFVSSFADENEMRFEQLQKLTVNIPISARFSKAPSGDLMLYTLTRNPSKALGIYTYAGSSNFIESIGETTVVSEASQMDIIQIDGNSEVLSIVSGDKVNIIQAVLVEY